MSTKMGMKIIRQADPPFCLQTQRCVPLSVIIWSRKKKLIYISYYIISFSVSAPSPMNTQSDTGIMHHENV